MAMDGITKLVHNVDANGVAVLGEVQTSPTANTVLDRLKTIATGLTTALTGIILAAGENHVGQVGSESVTIISPLTVNTAVYVAGDTVGGLITLANAVRVSGGSAILQSLMLTDRSNQKPTGNLLIFNASPAAATTTDHAAFAASTDDFKIVARIPVTTVDWISIASQAYANPASLGRLCKAASGTSLFAVFVTDGVPDFVAATDFQIISQWLHVN
jgi:hypothetical protein